MAPCSETGILGAVAGVMGCLQAVEVVKELLHLGEGLVGKLLLYDALEARFSTVAYTWDPANPLNGREPALRRPVASPQGRCRGRRLSMATETITTSCVIAGGGPAGMMCGFLLARAGVDVLVLEKHADFLRDFRGDTIHPSTLANHVRARPARRFPQAPASEVRELAGVIGDDRIVLADFSHLPTHCHFIALMPQWDFLDFLAEHAKRYPSFKLKMLAEVDGLCRTATAIVGLTAKQPQGRLEVRSNLVIGADGRHSIVREKAGLKVEDLGAPMDVLWFRLPKRSDDEGQTLGRIQAGVVFVMLDRGDYWQCAYVIRKGGFAELRREGLAAFRARSSR